MSSRQKYVRVAVVLSGLLAVLATRSEAQAQAFVPVDDRHVYVRGSDANLWFEHDFTGSVPPPRTQVDDNVASFQPLSTTQIYVQGQDFKLWYEHDFTGAVPPTRTPVDFNVGLLGFWGMDPDHCYVLGQDGKLWFEYNFAGTVPPPRVLVDSNVAGFQALGWDNGGAGGGAYVLGSDWNLWYEHDFIIETQAGGQLVQNTVPPPRVLVDSNVAGFQALDNNHVFVTGWDGNIWFEHDFDGTTPPPRSLVNVPAFPIQGLQAMGGLLNAVFLFSTLPGYVQSSSYNYPSLWFEHSPFPGEGGPMPSLVEQGYSGERCPDGSCCSTDEFGPGCGPGWVITTYTAIGSSSIGNELSL